MNRSIRKNILVLLLIAQGILTAGCATALVIYIKRQRVAVFDAEMDRRVNALVGMLQVDDRGASGLEFSPEEGPLPAGDLFVIRDLKGAVIASSPYGIESLEQTPLGSAPDLAFVARGQAYRGRMTRAIPVVDQDEEKPNQPLPQVDVSYAIPSAGFDATSRRIASAAIAGSLFWLASSCLIAWFSVFRGMLPLGELAEQASAVTERSWSLSVSPRVKEVSELRPLALAFEALILRLSAAFERERTFVSDAAHELKTVVAIQKSSVQVALQGPETASNYRDALERASEDIDRLNALVHRMLSLAVIEGSDRTRMNDAVLLDESILGACDQLRMVATSHRVTLDVRAAGTRFIRSEEDLLQTLWVTLLENAIRYSTPDSSITTSTTLEGRSCVVAIQDHGLGITEELLPHIFERFYRADSSRSRDNGSSGFGLGLSIAKAIVERHNGRIEVMSQLGLGTTFFVTLPLCEPAEPLNPR
jgi:signal transduction histidine kinase